MRNLILIAAMDVNRGIGKDNKLPWHLPEDLAHFKATTNSCPIIMGRKTFESIGRPLPNRQNIVVTRNGNWSHEKVEAVTTVEGVLNLLYVLDPPNAFVIGGSEIYREFMPHVGRIILTEINSSFDCDTFLEPFSEAEWKEVSRKSHFSNKNNFEYSFVEYHRIV